ncbi:hypothetical protein [Nocardia macrotermitis]|uniref:PPE family domain-containing protein n=1 Tax=Nocardia macrotermitis TaxID=2585198 RepID=A0A7K0CZ33_9NOCA|nr:hypothetical protein [Nocardia macrotermitis]MQY18192.1 hypothetical protein [Nocardia macrotermitis]
MGDSNDPQSPAPFLPNSPITTFQSGIPGVMSAQDIQKVQDAQRKVAESAAQAKAQNSQLSSLGAGTDPDYAKTDEHFAKMSHEEIYAAVHGKADGSGGMDVAGLQQLRKNWFDAASDLENLSTFNLLGMNNIFNHGLWDGVSGTAAHAASERVANAANQIGQVFAAVSQRLDSMAWAAEAIKLAVQPPPAGAANVTVNPDDPNQSILPGLINPAYADKLETQRKAARDAAVHAMEMLYTPSYPPAGSGIASYVDVPKVTHIGSDTTTSAPSNTTSAPNNANSQHGTEPAAAKPDSQQQDQQPSSDPTNSHSTGTTPAGLNSATTPQSTSQSPTSTTTAGYSPSTQAPGSANAAASDGFFSPGGGSKSSTGGGAGKSLPGVPGNATAAGAARAASAAAAGVNAARMPTGSMAPHAGKSDKQDEKEHFSPDYLRRVAPDWTAGLETPAAVIGPDSVAAQEDSAAETSQASAAAPRRQAPAFTEVASAAPTSDSPPPRTPDTPTESTTAEPPQPAKIDPALSSLFSEYGWGTDSSKKTTDTDSNSTDREKPAEANTADKTPETGR